MKLTNLLDSIVDEQTNNKRIDEIAQLIKEYDSLDSLLIENKSYTRDTEIVLRLDELGAFDEVLDEKRGALSPSRLARQQRRAAQQQALLNPNKTPDAVAPGVSVEPAQAEPDVPVPSAEPTATTEPSTAPQDAQQVAAVAKPGGESLIRRLFTSGKAGVSRLGNMMMSALKSGATKVAGKVKAVINKLRGREPNASLKDVPGLPPEVSATTDKIQATPDTEGEPGADETEPSTEEPGAEETPTETPTDTPDAGLEPTADAEPSLEPTAPSTEPEIPAPEEPTDAFDSEDRARMQKNAGIEPTPAPTASEPVATTEPAPAPTSTTPSTSTSGTGGASIFSPANRQPTSTGTTATTPAPAPAPAVTGGPPTPPPSTTEPKAVPTKSTGVAQPSTATPQDKAATTGTSGGTLSGTTSSQPAKPASTTPSTSSPSGPIDRDAIAAMEPEEREKYLASLGFKQKGGLSGLWSRVKDAGRGIVAGAKAGWQGQTSTQIKRSPRTYTAKFEQSVLPLMEALQQVETRLMQHQLMLAEELKGKQKNIDVAPPFGKITGADFEKLRSVRENLRKALVKEMVREELYSHNTTLAELNPYQLEALKKHVQERSAKLWELMAEMRMKEAGVDEGKFGRLAAGLGLAGAAMMGSPDDAGAQQATPTQAPTVQVPNDSVQTASSKSQDMALAKARSQLFNKKISSAGARQDVVQNPDGTFTATVDARKKPTQGGTPQMEEAYTLEEWMGMMEEAGYSLEEGFMDTLRGVGSKVAAGVKKVGHTATDVLSGNKIGTSAAKDARSAEVNKAYQARQDAEYEKTKQAYRAHQQAQRAGQQTAEEAPPLPQPKPRASNPLAPSGPPPMPSATPKGPVRKPGYNAAGVKLSATQPPTNQNSVSLQKGQKYNLTTRQVNENTISRLQQLAGIKKLND